MQYEVKIEDFTMDLDVEIKSSNFELIADIQAAIEELVEIYKEEDEEIVWEDEEDEESEEESEDDEEEEEEEDIVGNQGTTIIINR